jgi:putative redox protein
MTDNSTNSDDPKNLSRCDVHWERDMVFRGGVPGGPQFVLDGTGKDGPDMVIALLHAAGSCAGADVVSIFEKMKVKLESFRTEVVGRRNAGHPRRFNKITIRFFCRGEGLTQKNAERAVELSVTKYCSVLSTLDPDMPIETEVVIEE